MMIYVRRIAILLLCVLVGRPVFAGVYKIGLCVAATGRYALFLPQLIASAKKYFFVNDDVTLFIFTDQPVKVSAGVEVIYQKKLGWPYDSMYRYDMYLRAKQQLEKMDYIYSCDADTIFVDRVDSEIIAPLVAVIHPDSPDWNWATKNNVPYDRNIRSTAYMGPNDGTYYYAGAFYGGQTNEFFKFCETNFKNVQIDMMHGVQARVDDESHNNKYFFLNPPALALPSQYYCPPHLVTRYPSAKIMAVKKNDGYMRR